MLIISIFPSSHNVFKRLLIQGCLKSGLRERVNPLSNDKILDGTKLIAFADDKLKVAKMMISLFDGVENTVGKEENAGYQHFLLFQQCFS